MRARRNVLILVVDVPSGSYGASTGVSGSATQHDTVQLTEAFVSADNTHWLSTLAQRAGLGDASGAGLNGTTPIFEAWQTVANSLGISQADVAREVAGALQLPVADLASADPAALTFLPEGPASTYGVLPLRATDRELIVATSNPLDFDAEREIAFLSSRRTVFEIAPPDALSPASENAYGKAADAKEALAREAAAAEAVPEAVAETVAEAEAAAEAAVAAAAEAEAMAAAAKAAAAAAAAEAAAEAIAEAVAKAAELEVITETEVIRAEPFDQEETETELAKEPSEKEEEETELIAERPSDQEAAEPSGYEGNEVEVAALLTGEDVDLEPGGRLRVFLRSLLRTILGVFHRLRTLLSFGSESSDSSEPAAETTSLQIEEETELVAERPSEPESEASPSIEWTPTSSASEAHILIVDDADGDRLVMSTILVKGGFEVSEADDGSTALPFLDDVDGIDAILLDLQMKEMDGLETLKAIRKSKKTRAVPVVILTASQDPEDERQLLQAGADDYLRKPVDPLQLIDRVRAVLRRAQL